MKFKKKIIPLLVVVVIGFMVTSVTFSQATSENNARLKQYLKEHPNADANNDGVLTLQEARDHFRKTKKSTNKKTQGDRTRDRQQGRKQADPDFARKKFTEAKPKDKKGNGLRIASTGHSIVRPALGPLYTVALAAGFDGHHQFAQLSGGATGSPKAHWEKTGQKQKMKPALETGKWDVMTMGTYYDSVPEDFVRWIDLGLKHNKDMVFYIQDAWPRLRNPSSDYPLSFFESRQKEINSMISTIVKKLSKKYPNKVYVLPVGDGMVELVRRFFVGNLPGVDRIHVPKEEKAVGLYRDAIHPTDVVAQLEGYIYFSCIYKQNPADVPNKSLVKNTKLDKILREVAWKVVTAHPHTGVKQSKVTNKKKNSKDRLAKSPLNPAK